MGCSFSHLWSNNLSWSRAKPGGKKGGTARERERVQGPEIESTRGRATPPNKPKPTPFTHFSITMALRLLTFRGLWKLALYTASSPGHGWVLFLLLLLGLSNSMCASKLIHLYAEYSTFCCCGQCYNVINSCPAAGQSSQRGVQGQRNGGIRSPTKGVWPEDRNHKSRDVGVGVN